MFRALSLISLVFTTLNLLAQQQVQPAFAHLITYNNIRDIAISSNTKEAYFSIQDPLGEISVLAMMKKVDMEWQEPEILPFSGQFKDIEPFLSPDNLRLYFVSTRPLSDTGTVAKDYDIWYVERSNIDKKWGEPVNPGAPVNSKHNEFYPAITLSGNLYLTSDAPASMGKDDIFLCSWNGTSYETPVALNDSINSEGYEFNAYVSPDESFMLFSGYNRKDGLGSADLYISYRKGEAWTKAQNLGPAINSKYMDYCPFVDLPSKTLYFTSRRSQVERTLSFQSIDQLKLKLNSYQNGLSRIYKVKVGFIP